MGILKDITFIILLFGFILCANVCAKTTEELVEKVKETSQLHGKLFLIFTLT